MLPQNYAMLRIDTLVSYEGRIFLNSLAKVAGSAYYIFHIPIYQVGSQWTDLREHKGTIMHRRGSHNTTILQLYITYELHVSAISDMAIIRLDTIIRETI